MIIKDETFYFESEKEQKEFLKELEILWNKLMERIIKWQNNLRQQNYGAD